MIRQLSQIRDLLIFFGLVFISGAASTSLSVVSTKNGRFRRINGEAKELNTASVMPRDDGELLFGGI